MAPLIREFRKRGGHIRASAALLCALLALAMLYAVGSRRPALPAATAASPSPAFIGSWIRSSGIWVFQPADPWCGGDPWIDVFNASEAGFLQGHPTDPTVGGRPYLDDEVLELYTLWQNDCGPDIDPDLPAPPTYPPDWPPAPWPAPDPDQPFPPDLPPGFKPTPYPGPTLTQPLPDDIIPGLGEPASPPGLPWVNPFGYNLQPGEEPGAEPGPPPPWVFNQFPPDFLPGQEPGAQPSPPAPVGDPFPPPQFLPGGAPNDAPPPAPANAPGFLPDYFPDDVDVCGLRGFASDAPVSALWGDKQEATVDLHVRLPGRDFRLARSYSSYPHYAGSALIGNHWDLDVFRFVQVIDQSPAQPRLEISTPTSGTVRFEHDVSDGRWWPPYGGTQYIEQAGNYWRLVEPGEYEIDFYHDGPAAALDGAIYEVRDAYGNARRYTYDTTIVRLDTIYLNGTDATNAAAAVEFIWLPGNAPNFGKLAEARVIRWDNGDPVVTQKVHYTYKAAGDPYSDHTGSAGDLVQVVRKTLVDGAPSGIEPWNTRVTQYRYHRGVSAPESECNGAAQDVDEDTDGFIEWGLEHQLKAVILPEQIEHAVQVRCSGAGPCDVATEAATFLDLDDGAEVFNDGTSRIVMDLAAKVVPQYGPEDDCDDVPEGVSRRVVAEQHLQTACGCAGTSQATKLVYTYDDPDAPASGPEPPFDGVSIQETIADTTPPISRVQSITTSGPRRSPRASRASPCRSAPTRGPRRSNTPATS